MIEWINWALSWTLRIVECLDKAFGSDTERALIVESGKNSKVTSNYTESKESSNFPLSIANSSKETALADDPLLELKFSLPPNSMLEKLQKDYEAKQEKKNKETKRKTKQSKEKQYKEN